MSGAGILPWKVVAGAPPRPSGAGGEQPVAVGVVSLLTSRLPVWAMVHAGACGTARGQRDLTVPGRRPSAPAAAPQVSKENTLMLLRHLCAGLLLTTVAWATGCCCHRRTCAPPVVSSAPP